MPGGLTLFPLLMLAQAPMPIVQEVLPPGGQPGSTVRVTLGGKSLEKVTELWFDHAGIRGALPIPSSPDPKKEDDKDRKDGENKPNEPSTLAWDVSIDATVPPGLYDLRVVNALGVSAPRAFHVSAVPLVMGKDPEKSQPVDVEPERRVHGRVEEGEVEHFRIKAPRNARLVVECLGERIDSRIDATLEVREASGKRVGFSRDRVGLDPIVVFDAREGVEYAVDLWDFTYRGKFPYLLIISSAPRVLFAFPPALVPGSPAKAAFYGWNLPGGAPAASLDGPLEVIEAAVEPPKEVDLAEPGAFAGLYRRTRDILPALVKAAPPGIACEPLLLARATRPPLIETEPNDSAASANALALPAEACGKFDRDGDRDWYSFSARKGDAVEIEIRSARLGAPCDPLLLIARRERKEGGEGVRDLVFLDGRKVEFPREDMFERKFVAPSRDPAVVWSPPEDGEYLLQVRNRGRRSGFDAYYHLSLGAPQPSFLLVATHSENASGEATVVPRGSSQCCDVLVERAGGFTGSIRLSAAGLPAGASCPPAFVGPGENHATLVFSAAPDAAPWHGGIRISGTAEWNGQRLERQAQSAVMIYGGTESRHPLQMVHSRRANLFPLAVGNAAPFAVTLEPAEVAVPPGGKVALTAKVTRAGGFQESVLLAFQGLGERANPDENGNRSAKAFVDKEKTEQSIELKLRGDAPYGERTFAVYATSQVDYPENPSDPGSKKTKKRTTLMSSPVTVRVVRPFTLVPGEVAGIIPAGGRLRIPFTVRRLAGVEAEVEVSLDLPRGVKGFSAAAVKVKPGEEAAEIVIESAVDVPAASVEGTQLRARLQLAGKTFEEKVVLPFTITRVAPFRVLAGEIPAQAGRGEKLTVPFKLEVVAGAEGQPAPGQVTVGLKVPGNLAGLEASPVVVSGGAREGALELFIGEGSPAVVEGLELEAVLERGGKKFTATAPLPALQVGTAYGIAGVEEARFGLLRLELSRLARPLSDVDLPVRVKVTSKAGAEARAEAMFPKSKVAAGVLLDTSDWTGGPDQTFPLRVALTVVRDGSEVTEEHVVNPPRRK